MCVQEVLQVNTGLSVPGGAALAGFWHFLYPGLCIEEVLHPACKGERRRVIAADVEQQECVSPVGFHPSTKASLRPGGDVLAKITFLKPSFTSRLIKL